MSMQLFNTAEHTVTNDNEKYKRDFQTPPEFCRYMAAMVPRETRTILEPTPGDGNIIAALTDLGYQDITAPDDFFLMPARRFDAIVMNPPFSCKYAKLENFPLDINKHGMKMGYFILQRCMEMSDTVIALMPWYTLTDSDVRAREIKNFGLVSLTHLPRRTFEYARIQTVIMEMRRGYTGPTDYKVYDLLNLPA